MNLWEKIKQINNALVFFQAEDGIRDLTVTGVQTCALPIYWPSALLWSALIFPAWFIPVEEYEVHVAAEATLRAVASGRVVWQDTVEGTERRSLDGFARGLVLFGLLRVPSALGPENWRAV